MAETNGEGVEDNFEYKVEKRYVKVSRDVQWTKGWKQRTVVSVRMVKNKPKNPTWNDMYFPIEIRIPMFYEHETTELEVQPLPAGRVALELLKTKGQVSQ